MQTRTLQTGLSTESWPHQIFVRRALKTEVLLDSCFLAWDLCRLCMLYILLQSEMLCEKPLRFFSVRTVAPKPDHNQYVHTQNLNKLCWTGFWSLVKIRSVSDLQATEKINNWQEDVHFKTTWCQASFGGLIWPNLFIGMSCKGGEWFHRKLTLNRMATD